MLPPTGVEAGPPTLTMSQGEYSTKELASFNFLFIWQVSYRGESYTRPDYSTKELASYNLLFIWQVSYRGESYTRPPDYSAKELAS
jgi:hypothetical protein